MLACGYGGAGQTALERVAAAIHHDDIRVSRGSATRIFQHDLFLHTACQHFPQRFGSNRVAAEAAGPVIEGFTGDVIGRVGVPYNVM